MNDAPSDGDTQVIWLYEKQQKIYARAVSGWYAGWRWALVWATQLIFYGLAWLPWNGRQAVLFDLAARRFYLFDVVLYPQDFIYLTGLLVISAYGLFLFTAVAGRLWCGYACPQTVYTEIFMWLERVFEGDYAYFTHTGDGIGDPMPIYIVEFDPVEIWGPRAEGGPLKLYAELFEAYLAPIEEDA